ncbi:MAG: TonB-dependent receptor [Deltaproteobacteria bacterium]|nr:TonB-dependent receptor [Deltaproteobacteria bacterium]
MRSIALTCAWIVLALAIGTSTRTARAEGDDDAPAQPVITKAPQLLHFEEAVYPPDQKAKGVEATVILTIAIDDKGAVSEVEVASSAGAAFDAAAIAAAKKFVFSPAEIDGKPAPVKITYKYAFQIKEELVSLGPQINFEGTIKERFKKTPMPNVKVRIVDLDIDAVTDEVGGFAFQDIPVGTHKVELSAPMLITVVTEEEIVKGKKKTVTYFVEEKEEGVDEEEVVRAPRIKKESVETVIRTEEARRVPGTQGDTLKVVQNLPGVGRSSFGSGQLIVWGSSPKDTRVYVNGVEIPALYHGGGLRSTVNGDLVKSIDLSPGAYGADYGRGLGGLVKVETKNLASKGTHAIIAADVIDTSAMVSTAISKKARIGIAGRASYLDQTLGAVTSSDVGDFVSIPRYYDGQLLAQLELSKDETLTAFGLVSDDKLDRTIPSDDPSAVRKEKTHTGFWRAAAEYKRLFPDGASVVVAPSVGIDRNEVVSSFGDVPTEIHTTSGRYALRGAYRRKLNSNATLTVGADGQFTHTEVNRFGSITLPAREGDITVFGQPPGSQVNADDWTVNELTVGPYATAQVTVGKLELAPGLRIGPVLVDGSRLIPLIGTTPTQGYRRLDWTFDPRLAATYHATKKLLLRAGAGLYTQPPDPEDLSSVFGNPTLAPSSAVHLVLGGAYKLRGTLTLEVTAFAKYLWDLPARSEQATPALAQALDQDGVGRSYGGQLLLRQELVKGFFGWVTYSLIRSERRDHPDQDWRLFDYDQTHVLGVLASYQIGHGWEFGGRFRFTSGVPRTPVTDAYYDARSDQYDPIFGPQNSIRVPSFYQLDLRLERTITRPRYRLNLFLDVQNVTNRSNPEEIIYNYDFSRREYITGLPTLAVVGARVEL